MNENKQEYFSFLSFYMKYHYQPVSLWKIRGIETSLLFASAESLQEDDEQEESESEDAKPETIMLVVLIENHLHCCPFYWKIQYDPAIFKMRNDAKIFTFANALLDRYIQENKLTYEVDEP